ncbi:hypothetical protein [Actinocorallia longicatena]
MSASPWSRQGEPTARRAAVLLEEIDHTLAAITALARTLPRSSR